MRTVAHEGVLEMFELKKTMMAFAMIVMAMLSAGCSLLEDCPS